MTPLAPLQERKSYETLVGAHGGQVIEEGRSTHTFTVRARDAAVFARRFQTLQGALNRRGGQVLYLRWSYLPEHGEHVAVVHYQLSATTAPQSSVTQCASMTQPSIVKARVEPSLQRNLSKLAALGLVVTQP